MKGFEFADPSRWSLSLLQKAVFRMVLNETLSGRAPVLKSLEELWLVLLDQSIQLAKLEPWQVELKANQDTRLGVAEFVVSSFVLLGLLSDGLDLLFLSEREDFRHKHSMSPQSVWFEILSPFGNPRTSSSYRSKWSFAVRLDVSCCERSSRWLNGTDLQTLSRSPQFYFECPWVFWHVWNYRRS